jgi:hypothetical protein
MQSLISARESNVSSYGSAILAVSLSARYLCPLEIESGHFDESKVLFRESLD